MGAPGLPSASSPPEPPVPVPIVLSLPAARALRNVWRWLASVGELCNQELGTPFRRCLRLFEEAKDNCERALSFLFFLCYIIITFRPLCGLANGAYIPPRPLCGEGGPAGQSHNRCLPHCCLPHPGRVSPFHSWPPLLHHPPVHSVLPQEDDCSP